MQHVEKEYKIQLYRVKMLKLGTILKCLFATSLLLGAVAHGNVPKCCRGNANWIDNTNNCTDGTRIQLFCSDGFYAFDQRVEFYEKMRILDSKSETDNRSWLQFEFERDYSTYNISPDK